MKITRKMVYQAVEKKIISNQQADAFIEFIKNQPEQSPAFNLTNVLYYFGGLIAIGAMTLFMNLSWEVFGGWGLFSLSLCYAILALGLCHNFDNNGYKIPAGICATFVICLVPLAVYGLQKAMGWWPDHSTYHQYHTLIRWQWIFMELATLAMGLILAWVYRYPYMIMPIAVTLWYMSMDIAAMLGGELYNFELRVLVSMYFGLITVLIAVWVDIRSVDSGDYAFWLYIFGVMAFWFGLSSQESNNELSKLIYMGINLFMILIGVILQRKVFVIFGAIGCFYYLGYLAFKVFKLSVGFPIALTAIGFAIIYLGILWHKHETRLTSKLRNCLPTPLRKVLEAREELD